MFWGPVIEIRRDVSWPSNKFGMAPSRFGAARDYFVVDAPERRTGLMRQLWETRLLGDEVRKNQPYFVNI
jgi:hypothetical protein